MRVDCCVSSWFRVSRILTHSLRDELSRSDSLKEKRVYGWVGGRSLVSASAPQERWGALDRASKSLGRTSERHMA